MTSMLVALFSATASAQTRRISGVVTDPAGQPVGQVSVNVLGTVLGAYTNEAGRFTVPAPEGTVALRVRRIGYQQQTVTVNASLNDVTIKLAKDVLHLEKQVITGAATSIASENAANAVTVVTGVQVNRSPAPTLESALHGW